MPLDIDTQYRKEPLNEDDQGWLTIQFVIFIANLILIMLGCLIMPFVPSKYYPSRSPISLTDYFHRVKLYALGWGLIFLIIAFCVSMAEIRRKIDIFLGYRKVGIFKIIKIYNLGSSKLIRFNNWHFLHIPESDNNCDIISKHNIVEVERSPTSRLLSYKIVDQHHN